MNEELKGKTIKAISLWEPWASLIATGAKTIETRSWATNYRGILLICAAKTRKAIIQDAILSHWHIQGGLAPLVGKSIDWNFRTWPGIEEKHLNFGMAVATCTLVDCKSTNKIMLEEFHREECFGDYSINRFAWFLKNIHPIKPFPVKGFQGFFSVGLPDNIQFL